MAVIWTRSSKQEIAAREGCGGVGCRARDADATAACAYVDQWGWPCSERVCSDHGLTFDDGTYCLRHAGLFLTLGGNAAPLDCEYDDPFQRRPSMITWVPRLLDVSVRALLQDAAAAEPGRSVTVTQTIRAGSGDSVAWETRWTMTGDNGEASVALELEGYCDPTVVVRTGAMVVMRELAEWLRYHIHGIELDAVHELQMRDELLERARIAITGTAAAEEVALFGTHFIDADVAAG